MANKHFKPIATHKDRQKARQARRKQEDDALVILDSVADLPNVEGFDPEASPFNSSTVNAIITALGCDKDQVFSDDSWGQWSKIHSATNSEGNATKIGNSVVLSAIGLAAILADVQQNLALYRATFSTGGKRRNWNQLTTAMGGDPSRLFTLSTKPDAALTSKCSVQFGIPWDACDLAVAHFNRAMDEGKKANSLNEVVASLLYSLITGQEVQIDAKADDAKATEEDQSNG